MPLESIENVDQLEDLLSDPTDYVIDTVKRHKGDYIILGVGGKMGPSLAHMLKRAIDTAGTKSRVIGVSRFSSGPLEGQLNGFGVETIRADLLNRAALDKLPDAPNII